MKMALIQDSLLIKGGAERVFRYMTDAFPEADVLTIAYRADTTWPEFSDRKIITSPANRIVRSHNRFKNLFPLITYGYQFWDLRRYDVILSSSATAAKYISRFNGIHICYCYFPTRAIWNPDAYFNGNSVKVRLFRLLLPYLKKRDLAAAHRVHHYIAISDSSRLAIRKYYRRESDVLNCPIEFDRFKKGLRVKKNGYYLIVSRLERWKRLDYAIEAFNRSGRMLKIIGTGEDGPQLKAMAGDAIEFLGSVDDDKLVRAYGEAKALIFTPELEYGLIPLEASAAGTPVIALGRGGVTETMVPINRAVVTGKTPTAVFYDEQTPESLNAAIEAFEKMAFDRSALSRHAETYGIDSFKAGLRRQVEDGVSDMKREGPCLR